MGSGVVFYQLSRKVVNNHEKIPEDARQVVYYSLAIGHHVGVLDCLSELMVVPVDKYTHDVEQLPDGEARSKLMGVLMWNEIEINRSHVDELLPVLSLHWPGANDLESSWIQTLILCLQKIAMEPALYLILKMRE